MEEPPLSKIIKQENGGGGGGGRRGWGGHKMDTATISERGWQIPATYFPPGDICMYIYILQAHFHD